MILPEIITIECSVKLYGNPVTMRDTWLQKPCVDLTHANSYGIITFTGTLAGYKEFQKEMFRDESIMKLINDNLPCREEGLKCAECSVSRCMVKQKINN